MNRAVFLPTNLTISRTGSLSRRAAVTPGTSALESKTLGDTPRSHRSIRASRIRALHVSHGIDAGCSGDGVPRRRTVGAVVVPPRVHDGLVPRARAGSIRRGRRRVRTRRWGDNRAGGPARSRQRCASSARGSRVNRRLVPPQNTLFPPPSRFPRRSPHRAPRGGPV